MPLMLKDKVFCVSLTDGFVFLFPFLLMRFSVSSYILDPVMKLGFFLSVQLLTNFYCL